MKKIKCWYCGKRTTISMENHKYKCEKWFQLSSDVLFNEILIHTRYFNLVKKLATSKEYRRLYKENFPECRSKIKMKECEDICIHVQYPSITYYGWGKKKKFMHYKCDILTTVVWYSYKKNDYLNYIYYMIETSHTKDSIYEKIINRIHKIDSK